MQSQREDLNNNTNNDTFVLLNSCTINTIPLRKEEKDISEQCECGHNDISNSLVRMVHIHNDRILQFKE